MTAGQRISDYEFLDCSISAQSSFLYLYKSNSGLLRERVRARIRAFAMEAGWFENSPSRSSLLGQLCEPSLFGEKFVAVEASDFEVDDLVMVLQDMVRGALDHHVLLMVRDGSSLQETLEWRRAVEEIGLIEERPVTIDNYRAVTRFLLKSSDLNDVQRFGENDAFLARMKAFVQEGRRRSLLEVAMEIDRIVLTQVEAGRLIEGETERAVEQRAHRDLRLRLNQFLDERNTASFHPLLELIDTEVLAGSELGRLITRLFSATTSIVGGRDQRYKRNREGNPAVGRYLIWGLMILARERELAAGNIVVAFERLCQDYHLATEDHKGWLVDNRNWRQIAACLGLVDVKEATTLDRARIELCSALQARIEAVGGGDSGLRSLVPRQTESDKPKSFDMSA